MSYKVVLRILAKLKKWGSSDSESAECDKPWVHLLAVTSGIDCTVAPATRENAVPSVSSSQKSSSKADRGIYVVCNFLN